MDSPINAFKSNIEEAVKLLSIHEEKTGEKPGRRYDVEILNKSCIVLTTACWEAFVEDIATRALQYMLDNCTSPFSFPSPLLRIVDEEVKAEKHELRVFDLAGDGWRKVMIEHKDKMLKENVGRFNTPKFGNVDTLLKKVLGIDDTSNCWYWRGMSNQNAKKKLNEFIALRGSIAHELKTADPVKKNQADDYATFVIRIAIKTSNCVRSHVHSIVGSYPWPESRVGSFR